MISLQKEKLSSDRKAEILGNNFEIFLKEVEKRIPIFYALENKHKFHGEVLEIGAGSCWLSALTSKLPEVKKIYALDLSQDILDKVGNKIIEELGGNKNKINFVAGDFSGTIFEDKKFDFIICDAALHHAQDLNLLLVEMRRILKDDGFFIAVREPVKCLSYDLRFRKFGRKEIQRGSNEKNYSNKEWHEFFRQNEFDLNMNTEFNKNDFKTKLFRFFFFKIFNGIFFSRYYFVARKSEY